MGYLQTAPRDPGWATCRGWHGAVSNQVGQVRWGPTAVGHVSDSLHVAGSAGLDQAHCPWDDDLGEARRSCSASRGEARTGERKGDCEDRICRNRATV